MGIIFFGKGQCYIRHARLLTTEYGSKRFWLKFFWLVLELMHRKAH